MSYESWRCTWQDSEQAARAAYADNESLRAQLAEERQQKHEALHREYCRREELERRLAEVTALKDRLLQAAEHTAEEVGVYYDQLLATQAHAARVVEALKGARVQFAAKKLWDQAVNCEEAISATTNLDALREHDARTLEEVIGLFSPDDTFNDFCDKVRFKAAAHRAKKGGK